MLTTLSDEGALTLPDGVPSAVTVERPRQKEHGDYATNVALQLAKKAGHEPARPRRAAPATGCVKVDGHRAVDIAGPGFLNITVEAGAQGVRSPARSWPPGRRTAPARRCAGAADQRRVHLAPTRPARCTSATPAGPRSATRSRRVLEAAGAEVTREFYINDRGAQMDRFGALAGGRGAGRAGARGRLPRRATSPSSRSRWSTRRPRDPRPARRRARGAFREAGYALQLREQQAARSTTSAPTSTSGSPSAIAARVRRGRPRPSSSCASQGHVYETDGALWMRTDRLRRRQGPGADPVRRRADLLRLRHGLLPRQARAAASTAASTCSAPTTTATSAGCMAMAACAGDDPDAEPRGASSASWSRSCQDGEEVRLSKRAGTIVTLARAGRRDRRRRRALLAGPLPAGLAARPRRRRRSPRRPATTRSSTSSTPTRGSASILRNAADLGMLGCPRRSTPTLLTHEKEGDLLRALAEFPRVVAGRRRAARAAPGRALPRGHRGDVPPVLRQRAGCCPMGDEEADRPATGPGCCWSTPPAPCSPTASTCSASPPRSGCEPR